MLHSKTSAKTPTDKYSGVRINIYCFMETEKKRESKGGEGQRARDAIKLALPGFRHPVEWWGLPTRLEWALAPDRGA